MKSIETMCPGLEKQAASASSSKEVCPGSRFWSYFAQYIDETEDLKNEINDCNLNFQGILRYIKQYQCVGDGPCCSNWRALNTNEKLQILWRAKPRKSWNSLDVAKKESYFNKAIAQYNKDKDLYIYVKRFFEDSKKECNEWLYGKYDGQENELGVWVIHSTGVGHNATSVECESQERTRRHKQFTESVALVDTPFEWLKNSAGRYSTLLEPDKARTFASNLKEFQNAFHKWEWTVLPDPEERADDPPVRR